MTDIAGFALISGNDENAGKYVDGKGKLYRRQGHQMISVETGAAINFAVQKQDEFPPPQRLELPGSKREEKLVTFEQMEAEASGEGSLAAELTAKPADVIEASAEEDGASALGGVTDRTEQVMLDYSPDEIRLMLQAARSKGVDVTILEGDDEITTRTNAASLARIAE